MESDLILFLAILFALSVLLMIRVCRDSERVALNTPQRFVKLIGPGLFLKLPWPVSPYEYTHVRIGDRGRYIGNGWAEIERKNIPVTTVEPLDIDATFRVKDFVNQAIFVAPADEQPA